MRNVLTDRPIRSKLENPDLDDAGKPARLTFDRTAPKILGWGLSETEAASLFSAKAHLLKLAPTNSWLLFPDDPGGRQELGGRTVIGNIDDPEEISAALRAASEWRPHLPTRAWIARGNLAVGIWEDGEFAGSLLMSRSLAVGPAESEDWKVGVAYAVNIVNLGGLDCVNPFLDAAWEQVIQDIVSLGTSALDQHPKVRIDVGVTPFGHHRDVDTFKALAETVCDGAYIGGTMLPKGASIGRSSISTDDTPDSTSMSTIH